MSYTLSHFPNKEYDFPPPPEWLVWTERARWDAKSRTYVSDGTGQVRHYSSLQKAKKQVSPYNSSSFRTGWAIYKWNGTKYVKYFEGDKGQEKVDCELFRIKVKRDDTGREVIVDDHEVEAAIESILASA